MTVNNENITCTSAEEGVWKDTNDSDITIQCPMLFDSICGRDKPFACLYGEWDTDTTACVCYPGWIGDICDIVDSEIKELPLCLARTHTYVSEVMFGCTLYYR